MKRHIILSLLLTGALTMGAAAQETDTNTEDEKLNQLRTESGIDPTRITSRVGYSVLYYAMENKNAQVNNRIALNLGVNRWSFSLKPEIVSINRAATNQGFKTGMGDIKFTLLNAFYVKSKIALAGSVEFGLPTGGTEYGTGYFSLSPGITLSYTITPSLFLAIQPQYTFSLSKADIYPKLNVLSVRVFAAYFTKTGYFFVLEPRPLFNFENGETDLIISPLVGKSLGGGFNLIALAEVPVTQPYLRNRGVLIQLGVTKAF